VTFTKSESSRWGKPRDSTQPPEVQPFTCLCLRRHVISLFNNGETRLLHGGFRHFPTTGVRESGSRLVLKETNFNHANSRDHKPQTPEPRQRDSCHPLRLISSHNSEPQQPSSKMTDTARWKSTVYVGGLSPGVTVQTLQEAFLPFGEIADVSLPKNVNPNTAADEPHRGFAYVEFEDAEDAKEAIDNMDQAEIFGRVIKVSAAKAPKSAGQGLGGKTAVWEQVSCSFVFSQYFISCVGVNCECRKGGLRSMLLVRRISWRRSRLTTGLKTQCKGLRDWILQGLNRCEGTT